MALLVMKFGGTSVANIERIRHVAETVKAEVDAGHQVAVVVSAMSGTTNQLVDWCRDVSPLHDAREYDVVVSAGEQITCGLLAMTLQTLGVSARSWLGWQIPLRTVGHHGAARIDTIETDQLMARFKDNDVAVIAGFQGIGSKNRVTTLGRGGSDTTAVAIAAALGADRCDIYTDVDGVYTTDPRIVPKARKLDRITYEEMLEMASLGAKVLQTRSVALAMRYGVKVQVLSSFEKTPGTLVVSEEDIVEQQIVSGITHSSNDAAVALSKVPNEPGAVAAVFEPLSQAGINVDMIVQSESPDRASSEVTFTVPEADLDKALQVLEAAQPKIGFKAIAHDRNVVKVSVIGVGMRSHTGVASTMFKTLAEKGINIEAISTSEIKISVLLSADYTELAVRALHTAYGLDKQ